MDVNTSEEDITSLALALVGEFAAVQDNIDGFVNLYAQRRAPSLFGYLQRQNILTRLPDRERPNLLLAIAEEMKADGDRSKFKDVFHRVKSVRDAISHAADMERVDGNNLRLARSVWSGAGALRGDQPTITQVTREQLRLRLHDARWLLQHVRYVIGADDLVFRMHYRGEQFVFAQPPADPSDWGGDEFAVAPSIGD